MDSLVKHSFMPRVSSLIFDGGILFYFYFFCFVECFRGTKNLFSQAGSSSWFLLLHKELLKNPLCKSVDPRRLRNRMYANSSTAWHWNHIKHHFFFFWLYFVSSNCFMFDKPIFFYFSTMYIFGLPIPHMLVMVQVCFVSLFLLVDGVQEGCWLVNTQFVCFRCLTWLK